MSTAPIPVPEASAGSPRPLGQMERVFKIFYAPSETFADLRRSSNWLLPWIIAGIFSFAFTFTVQNKVGWPQVVENQNRLMSDSQQAQMEQMPPDQRAVMQQRIIKSYQYISFAFPLVSLIISLIFAVVLWGTFNFGLGTELTFNQALAVVIFSGLVGIFKSILTVATLLGGVDTGSFMLQNPVGTNPGYFMGIANTSKWLYLLASSIDVLTIWALVLMGIGFAVLGKLKKSTGIAVVLGWYAVVTLVRVGFAAM